MPKALIYKPQKYGLGPLWHVWIGGGAWEEDDCLLGASSNKSKVDVLTNQQFCQQRQVKDESTKHLYYFGVICCASNVSCVINFKVLR